MQTLPVSYGFLYDGEVLRSPDLVDGVGPILAALLVGARAGTSGVQTVVTGRAFVIATDSPRRLPFDGRVA